MEYFERPSEILGELLIRYGCLEAKHKEMWGGSRFFPKTLALCWILNQSICDGGAFSFNSKILHFLNYSICIHSRLFSEAQK